MGSAFVAAGNLYTMLEKVRREFDKCIALETAGKLTPEDIGRCNFCVDLLGKKTQFTTAPLRPTRRKPAYRKLPVLSAAE